MVAILLDHELIPITSEQAENACTAGYKCPDKGRTRAIFNSRVGGLKSAQKKHQISLTILRNICALPMTSF